MSSYSRRCRTCNRWISLRQMPHGRYVAFEGDAPHKCSSPPPPKPIKVSPPKLTPSDNDGGFIEIEIPGSTTNPEAKVSGSAPTLPSRRPTPISTPSTTRGQSEGMFGGKPKPAGNPPTDRPQYTFRPSTPQKSAPWSGLRTILFWIFVPMLLIGLARAITILSRGRH
jgi:hypothetical protein